ncbi:MAG: peptidase M64, partial [Alistipes sp.]|nr:peptidase M64 [Alistipes sp.]
MKRFIMLMISLCGVIGLNAQEFNQHFQNKTLRIDYIFAGNASAQIVALDELAQSDGWAGRRVNMGEIPVRGNGDIKVIDPASGKILYRNSFSSLFQEWLTTDEAQKLSKSFEATFLVPFPKQNVLVEIALLDNEGKTQATLRHEVNPEDKLIRKLSAPTPTPHEYLLKSGSEEEKIDIAIIAEGYTAEQMYTFMKDARTACDEIFRYEPFASM